MAGTDRFFTGPYNGVKDEGTYPCAYCGNPLFDNRSKYEQGCGWPSFGEALPGSVQVVERFSHGMAALKSAAPAVTAT